MENTDITKLYIDLLTNSIEKDNTLIDNEDYERLIKIINNLKLKNDGHCYDKDREIVEKFGLLLKTLRSKLDTKYFISLINQIDNTIIRNINMFNPFCIYNILKMEDYFEQFKDVVNPLSDNKLLDNYKVYYEGNNSNSNYGIYFYGRERQINIYTKGVLMDMNWDNVILAGGLINLLLHKSLLDNNVSNYDIDLFIYGTKKEKKNKLKELLKFFSIKNKNVYYVFRTKNIVEVYIPDKPTIQIILSSKFTIDSILLNFDLSHVKVCYDGKTFYGTYDYLLSQIYNISIVNTDQYITSNRIYKAVVERKYNLVAKNNFEIYLTRSGVSNVASNLTIEDIKNAEYTKYKQKHFYKALSKYTSDKILNDLNVFMPHAIKITNKYDELDFSCLDYKGDINWKRDYNECGCGRVEEEEVKEEIIKNDEEVVEVEEKCNCKVCKAEECEEKCNCGVCKAEECEEEYKSDCEVCNENEENDCEECEEEDKEKSDEEEYPEDCCSCGCRLKKDDKAIEELNKIKLESEESDEAECEMYETEEVLEKSDKIVEPIPECESKSKDKSIKGLKLKADLKNVCKNCGNVWKCLTCSKCHKCDCECVTRNIIVGNVVTESVNNLSLNGTGTVIIKTDLEVSNIKIDNINLESKPLEIKTDLEVSNITGSDNIIPDLNKSYNLAEPTKRWETIYTSEPISNSSDNATKLDKLYQELEKSNKNFEKVYTKAMESVDNWNQTYNKLVEEGILEGKKKEVNIKNESLYNEKQIKKLINLNYLRESGNKVCKECLEMKCVHCEKCIFCNDACKCNKFLSNKIKQIFQ